MRQSHSSPLTNQVKQPRSQGPFLPVFFLHKGPGRWVAAPNAKHAKHFFGQPPRLAADKVAEFQKYIEATPHEINRLCFAGGLAIVITGIFGAARHSASANPFQANSCSTGSMKS